MKQDAESTQGEATEHSAHLQLAPNRLLAKRGSKSSYQQDELCHCQVTLLASKLTCCPTFRWVREKQFQYFVKQNNGLDFFLGKKKKLSTYKKKKKVATLKIHFATESALHLQEGTTPPLVS